MRIIFSGGGTIGSVSPLIAIYEEIKTNQPQAEFLWLGTRNGPEKKLISSYQIPLKQIFSGKLRRYFSLKNFIDPILIFFGFWQAIFIVLKFRPDSIISAGGFVAVPVIWAGWILRRPILIHQQDIRPGLANKLSAPFASIVTVSFKQSLRDFNTKKVHWVGNPVRLDILSGNRDQGIKYFKLDPSFPTVLVIGGGTGALNLNNLILNNLKELVEFCQIIHLTGGKTKKVAQHSRYHEFSFLTSELKNAYAAADLIISRAGMSTLSEIAALQKPSIIIPISNSHQQENANEFFRNNAVITLDQKNLNNKDFTQTVKELLNDSAELSNLSRNISKVMPGGAAEKIVKMIL
ncbi:MAG: hypothetical protein CMI53_03625 [Parcubacteria group bacterium]|nr:hypothetical protein [Parcubacteria group bacterium]|tara:strand:- start:349 stop:1395 length:1047 start_codon:yes stop_codon:yes gene_type:complete